MERINLEKIVSTSPFLDEQAWALCFKGVKYIQTMHGPDFNLTLASVDLIVMGDGEISLGLDLNLGENADSEPVISGQAEAELVLALGRMVVQSMKPTPEGDKDPKLYDLLSRMTGDSAKRPTLERVSQECEVHAKGDADERYTSVLRLLVCCYHQLIQDANEPKIDQPGEEDEEEEMSDYSSDDEYLSTSSDLLDDTDEDFQDNSQSDNDTSLAKSTEDVGHQPQSDANETTPQPDSVDTKSDGIHSAVSEKDQYGDDNGTLSEEETSKEKSNKAENYPTMTNLVGGLVQLQTYAEENNVPQEPVEIMFEVIKSVMSEKDQDAISRMQEATNTDTISGNTAAAGLSLDAAEPQKIKQENYEQQESGIACELYNPLNNNHDNYSVVAGNGRNVPGAWCADLPVPQTDEEMGFDKVTNSIKLDQARQILANVEGDIGSNQVYTYTEPTVQGSSPRIAVNSEPSKENGDHRCDEDTPKMQDTTVAADTESSNMAAKPTGNEDEPQNGTVLSFEERYSLVLKEQESSAVGGELNVYPHKPSLLVNWGNVPEAWCAELAVQQLKENMGIDQDMANVPKRNWTKPTRKGTIENTQLEATEEMPEIEQAEEQIDAEPTDGDIIPEISVNWGDVPEQWSAQLSVQQVKVKMGIKEENVVRPKKIVNKTNESTMAASSKDVEESDGSCEELSQEESAPTTIKWGNVPEKWEANLTVHQVKAKMGMKEKKVVRPRKKSDEKKEVELQADELHEEETVTPPMTVNWGNEPEQWAAQLNLQQIKKQMGIKEEGKMRRPRKMTDKNTPVDVQIKKMNEPDVLQSYNSPELHIDGMPTRKTPPITVKWGIETEEWAAQLNLKQIKKKMGIKEENQRRTRKSSGKNWADWSFEVDTNATTEEELENVKDSNNMDEAEDTQTGKTCTSLKPKLEPSIPNFPSRGERLTKEQLEEYKARVLKRAVPNHLAFRIQPLELGTEPELQPPTALEQPNDAGFLRSMLYKAGTYINPFQWTKATAEPTVDSNLNVNVESDLTSKKAWLPSGVRTVLHGAADVSVVAALGCCAHYNVLSVESVFDLALIYCTLTSKPTVADAVFNIVASQTAGFFLSPMGQAYLFPKISYRLAYFG